jgi:nucleotide-binding universal stress UspA family protein
MPEIIFRKILYAYGGSEGAFDAFRLALDIAKQSGSELHIVSVAQVDYIPQFVYEVREQKALAVRRLRGFLFRARAMAAERNLSLKSYVRVGHPVREIVRFARDLDAELLVIGAKGHSAVYECIVGSRTDRIVQLAPCPVLVVKNKRPRRGIRKRLRRWFGPVQDAWKYAR